MQDCYVVRMRKVSRQTDYPGTWVGKNRGRCSGSMEVSLVTTWIGGMSAAQGGGIIFWGQRSMEGSSDIVSGRYE